jgi:hypothetical protein
LFFENLVANKNPVSGSFLLELSQSTVYKMSLYFKLNIYIASFYLILPATIKSSNASRLSPLIIGPYIDAIVLPSLRS